MNLEHLEQLITFKEQGTLSKAAEVLLISQPALTRSMQKLEEELNIPLFERQKNKLMLTETGEFVVEEARKLLTHVDSFQNKIRQYHLRKMIFVGGVSAPGVAFELENRIGKERFEQQFQLTQEEGVVLKEGLLNHSYDFVVTDSPVEDERVHTEPYFKEVLNLALPINHPLANRNVIHLDDFKGLTMLLRTNLGIWDRFVAQLNDTTFIHQDNNEIFAQLVEASDLPVFTTNITVEYGVSSFYRKHIPIDGPYTKVTFYINVLKEHKEILKYIK